MGWHHNDLTAAAGAPLPAVDQSMIAYAFEDQGTQHVIYVSQDLHVEELWWNNSGWHHNDLTAAASAPLPAVDQGITAYAFEDQGTQHVIYVRQDLHVEELWWDNDGWHRNDLTAAAGAPLPAVDQSMSAYAFEDKAPSMSSTSGRTFMLKSFGGTTMAGIITTLRPRPARHYQLSIKA